jgi:hypothetical protein
MKSATQFALYGAGAIVLSRLFYIITSFGIFGMIDRQFYIAINTIDLFASIAILNFFYVLYQKQNTKPKRDE